MAWNPENFQPPQWQPPDWQPGAGAAQPPTDDTLRVAFLDMFGRFCKDPRELYEIRMFRGTTYSSSMTVVEYRALSRADQEELQLADSAAGLIDTSDKSNA